MTLFKHAALVLAAVAMATCGPKAQLAAPAPPAPAPASVSSTNNPALWRTGDADTTIYLFGTVHVLPPSLDWRTAKIDAALNEAGALYFETDLDPAPNEIASLLQRLGYYPPSERLSDKLSAEDRIAFRQAADDLGFPVFQLDSMKPWLAGVTIAEAMITKAGYDANSGVERKLAPTAIAAGKEIRKLETIEEQLLALADLPEKAQLRFLMDGVREMGEESAMLAEMVNAWAAGDAARLEQILIEEDFREMPEIYQALLVRRNANWAKRIDQIMKDESGTFFIAVGAAHLIGDDSVIEMLRPLGHTTQRVE